MPKAFSDFSGGDAGVLDLSKVPDNFFRATNMLMYRDGSLGPRPGFRAFPLAMPGTAIRGLGWVEAEQKSLVCLTDSGTVIAVNSDGSASTQLGTGVTLPTAALSIPPLLFDVTRGTGFMFVGNGGSGYRIRPLAPALDTLNTSAGVAATLYGLRMVRSETASTRWFYSDPNNTQSWPAGNFFDVAVSNRIVFMAEQRNHLVILTGDGSWWVLTGVPGVNDTFRRISGGRLSPAWIVPNACVNLGDDNCYYLSPDNNYPVIFNGEKHEELSYLSMTPENPLAGYGRAFNFASSASYRAAVAVQGADNSSPVFVLPKSPTFNENGRILLKHNGVWTNHKMGTPVSYFWATDGRGRLIASRYTDTNPVWATNQLLETDLRLNRPSFVSDLRTSPGDLSNTPVDAEVTFPEQWSANGDELIVTEVMVDFIRWNTGAPVQNRIQAEVTALSRGRGSEPMKAQRVWEQLGSDSPTTFTGKEDRVRFNFGDQGSSGGWRLRLSGLRGVAIRNIVVFDKPVKTDTRLY